MISPAADYMNPGHETADLVLTITDPSGSVIFDSGCQGGGQACGYGGSIFSGTFTVVAVPEPATAGLALAGLGLVIAASRRRARPSRVRA